MKTKPFSKPKPHRTPRSALLDLHATGALRIFRRLAFFRLFDPSPLDPQPLSSIRELNPHS